MVSSLVSVKSKQKCANPARIPWQGPHFNVPTERIPDPNSGSYTEVQLLVDKTIDKPDLKLEQSSALPPTATDILRMSSDLIVTFSKLTGESSKHSVSESYETPKGGGPEQLYQGKTDTADILEDMDVKPKAYTREGVLRDATIEAKMKLSDKERSNINDIVQKTLDRQYQRIEKLPNILGGYSNNWRHIEYFDSLESTYPGIIEAFLDTSESFDDSKLVYRYEKFLRSENKLFFARLILGIFCHFMEKMSYGFDSWGYDDFLIKLKIILSPEDLRGIMTEVIKVINGIYYPQADPITLDQFAKTMTKLWSRVKTVKHKQYFWFLQHNPFLVPLYNESKRTQQEHVMIHFLVNEFQEFYKNPQMRSIIDHLIQSKATPVLYQDIKLIADTIKCSPEFDGLFMAKKQISGQDQTIKKGNKKKKLNRRQTSI